MKLTRLLGATALFSSLVVLPAAAYAQASGQQAPTSDAGQTGVTPATTAADQTEEQETGKVDVVVTGSRIARPTLDSPVPITSVSAAELLSRSSLSIGDTLNTLPQFRSTFSQSNSTRFIGTAGINALDLRGLGTARTLVLVDGHRIISATPGINRPDANTVPNDLLDRVDTVTGGNSAVYGSDAVAGVVNFVLKRDFEGVRVRAQSGVAERGDAPSRFLSVTAGHNFAGGRGNMTIAGEYAYQDVLFFTQREGQTGAFGGRSQFNTVQNTGPNLNTSYGPLRSGAEPSTGDGIPDTAFLTGVKNNSISEGGLFTAACPTAAATGESAAAFSARRAAACTGLANPASANTLAQFGNTYVFLPDGSLVRNPCVTDLRFPSGGASSNCVGGLGSTLRLTGMLQPKLERKAFNYLAHFEVSPAFDPFVRVQFVRTNSLQEGQPTFFNNSFSVNNPFLTDQARATLVANLAPGATTFTAQRFDVDFAGRGERHRRDNFQVVGGVRGDLGSGFKYDASFNYGHLYTFYATAGNLVRAKYANSLNAVLAPAGYTGTTYATPSGQRAVCGVNADASTTNDDAACVPVNLFGQGAPSAAALSYFGYTSTRVQRANLYDGVASISGDTSSFLTLPGGGIEFALGGEYRRETAFAGYDALTSSTACGVNGCTFLNVIPDFRPPALVVKEGFAEVNVPLVKDRRFFQELSISGAGRVSDYNIGRTGTVWTYNVNGVYAPVRDLRFRAGYAKAVRAPTQSDLFATPSQTFLNGFVDPCSQSQINNNPNRAKNCAAAGVPTTQTFNGTTEPFTNRPNSGVAGVNAGNATLSAEESKSLTIGAVFQPSFVPGLSLTVDYYRISIKNALFTLAPQTIINQCYDNPGGISNPFCAAVFRNPNGTLAGQSDVIQGGAPVSLTPTGPAFSAQPFNYARQVTSGLDVDLLYRRQVTSDVSIVLRGITSKTFLRTNYTDVTRPDYATRQLGTLGDPEWQGQLSANLITGGFNFGYRLRYIGKQTVSATYETQNSFQGRPAENPDAFPFVYYPSYSIHDARIDYSLPGNKYKFYLGVDNFTDKLPPYDLLGTESGSTYPVLGRYFYAGVELKF